MRLSRIEIKGFKSFAEETHIHFNEDIIGIVGPNGSGKSNVVDAIRWVLGEQSSRELRLENMGDVIFNGSKTRKPGKVARVSLTFENTKNLLSTEFSEVTLTRRLYRTGESEYLINDVKCRLKDIRSLFLDSGVGSNSYAIIALGMVDDILADKENARRMMFEEAAGISKYKDRKKETLQKLKHTQEDLDRIEDLVFEIQKNLKTLERQAKRTKRFYEIKEEYKKRSIELSAIHLVQHRKDKKETESKLTQESDHIRELETAITHKEAEIESVRKSHTDQELALSQSQKEINTLVSEIRNLEENARIAKQQLEFRIKESREHSQRIELWTRDLEKLTKQKEIYEDRVEKEEKGFLELKDKWEQVSSTLQGLKEKYESSKLAYDDQYKQIRSMEQLSNELEKSIAISESRQDTYTRDQQRFQQSIQEIRMALETRRERIEELEQEEKKWNTRIAELDEIIFAKQSEQEILENEEEAIVKVLQRLNRELDAKTHERKLLQEFLKKMEGFPESIRYLSQHLKWKGRGIILSDLLSADPPYRGLLENYLDQYLNYFVVETISDAVEAVHLLHQEDKGRAYFFILDELKEPDSDDTTAMPGEVKALDVVKFDPRYQSLFSHLLNGVYFGDGGAQETWSDQNGKILITLDGLYQRSEGQITGGVVGLFEGSKLGRQQQIDQLEVDIAGVKEKIAQCEKDLDRINGRISELDTTELDEQIKSWKISLEGIRTQIMKLKTTQEIEEKNLAREEEALKKIEDAQRSDTKSWEAQKLEHKKLKQQLADLQQELSDKDVLYRSISEEYNELRQTYNQLHIQMLQQQNLLETVQREQEIVVEKIKILHKDLNYSQQKVAESEESVRKLNFSMEEIEKSLHDQIRKREEREQLLNDAEKKYYKIRSTISQLESEVKVMNQQFRNSQSLINGWKDNLNATKFAISRIIERMEIEFGVGEKDIPEEVDDTLVDDRELIELECEKLKSRIQSYGEINPLAVEAYDEIKERHDNIVKQRDDVVQARDQLMETISEIETTATTKFMEAFNRVRDNFIEVFRRLFTEDDTCDLVLLEPENPLESKIEIVAKPKGKKPKSISQLSGGEKTLTATALLFALYLLKPAPFCIFDEVDAPLDDANISKFNRIIKEFSRDSQFIIITHNKLTMEAVDVIYGVFMENSGVSKVAAVDFRHLDEISEFATVG